jgi:hypothetical protein
VAWWGCRGDALSQTPPRVCKREGLGVAAGVVTYTPAFASEKGCRRVDWRPGAYTPQAFAGGRGVGGGVAADAVTRPPRVCGREGVAAWGHVIANTPCVFVSMRGRRG